MPLIAVLGDPDRAIGQAVRFFRMAQDKHKNGKLITEDEFERSGFSESLIGIFADRVNGGIQAVGAQKHFGWLTKRVEAGRAGGKQTQANASKAKQPEASPSPSYSPSLSQSASPSHVRGHARNFNTVGDLLDSIPLVTVDQWSHRYKNWSWVSNEIALAFAFHSSDPSTMPGTHGAWMKKLHTWLNKADKDLVAQKKTNSLDDLILTSKEPA